MLEWGSGNSSRWFSSRVKSLYSVEHNEEWLNHVKSFALTNQTIVFSTQDKYASTALEFQRTFDLILIDGVEREACGEVAISLLSNGGMIILDNSDRHPDISEKLRAQDLIQVDFHGFGPINPYTWTTSVFMRRDYRISPIDRQPRIPIGGGY
jgi:predicted O-methyltransferase YrrM